MNRLITLLTPLRVRAAFYSALLALAATLSLSSCGYRTIGSVSELAEVAALSGVSVKMRPGTYQLSDYLTDDVILATPYADSIKRKAMLHFSGSGNSFDFEGVTLEIDTRLLAAFDASINGLYITGSHNTLRGLTIRFVGDEPPTTRGARSFVVTGDYNTIDGVTLYVRGSHPFGYGDLLGKGSQRITRLNKHSAFLVEGLADTILNCRIYSEAFGHLFFVQGGRDVYFENCYAESSVRTTDDMLAEGSGVAYDLGFRSIYKNRLGQAVITPGYVKSMSECGFRNYGSGGPAKHTTGRITLVNCSAKHTRIGFAFTRIGGDITVDGCSAEGCEVGYYISGADVLSSRGDALYGPLLNLSSYSPRPSTIDLTLTSAVGGVGGTVHCVAALCGRSHDITLRRGEALHGDISHPIVVGVHSPSANNGFSAMGMGSAVDIQVRNLLGAPVFLTPMAVRSTIVGDGTVQKYNRGISNI